MHTAINTKATTKFTRVAATVDVERAAPGGAPVAFRIWREGPVVTDHGEFVFSESSAKLIEADIAARGVLYPFNVDHLSSSKSAPIELRAAVGWHRIEVRRGDEGVELWAVDCQWDPEIEAGFEAKPPKWRYFSPEFDVVEGEITRYYACAVTNNPATFEIQSIAANRLASDSPDIAPIDEPSSGDVGTVAESISMVPGLVQWLTAQPDTVFDAFARLVSVDPAELRARLGFEEAVPVEWAPAAPETQQELARRTRSSLLATETAVRTVLLAKHGAHLEPSVQRWAATLPLATLRSFLAAAGQEQPAPSKPRHVSRGLVGEELARMRATMGTSHLFASEDSKKLPHRNEGGHLVLPSTPPREAARLLARRRGGQ